MTVKTHTSNRLSMYAMQGGICELIKSIKQLILVQHTGASIGAAFCIGIRFSNSREKEDIL